MPFQQTSLSARAIASLLWVVGFGLLLSFSAIAPYDKTGSIHVTTGLVKQFDSLATLHDNHFRISHVKTHSSERSSLDIDQPDWQSVVSNSAFSENLCCTVISVSDYDGPDFSQTTYLRPQYRAPPHL